MLEYLAAEVKRLMYFGMCVCVCVRAHTHMLFAYDNMISQRLSHHFSSPPLCDHPENSV